MQSNLPFLSEEEIYLFNRGELYHSYLKFGAHLTSIAGVEGGYFAVWAPHAKYVSVVGDFNHWSGANHPMNPVGTTGVWTLFIPGLQEGELYKYEIHTADGDVFLKADPFAFYSEVRPATASIIYSLDGYEWGDSQWLLKRKSIRGVEDLQSPQSSQSPKNPQSPTILQYPQDHLNTIDQDPKDYQVSPDPPGSKVPLLIYELHLGSWKRKEDGSFYTYCDLAAELIDYVLEMGYTHIELLPLMEHPYDGSWGYQGTGYYSCTSRYGEPRDLMAFIDACHQAGIGVILDWVPGHFCKDAHGLGRFDGVPLYENEEHVHWGTYTFDFSKTEVWSFLISNALFWLDKFHIDGLRVDGVSSMLYLDYGKEGCSWQPNIYGGRENLHAVAFLKHLNEVVHAHFPGVLMIAEEATDWPLVSHHISQNGLGFDYKWNMGWMNDTLRYIKLDFPDRKFHHQWLTFSMMYAFSENFILPLSHDEVVHGKKSLLDKMPGDYWKKFAGLRTLYSYFLCHPGKKLIFMGHEIAQFIEWREDRALDWFLLDYEMHHKYHVFTKYLNTLYRQERALWENDQDWSGFEWIDVHNYEQSILVFCRRAKNPKDFLIILINFLPIVYQNYRIGVPLQGTYQEILNSDAASFGGSNQVNPEEIQTEGVPWHGREFSIKITVPPLGAVIFKPTPTIK